MSENKKKLFLLDAFALIYRAHFAFSNNPRISSRGLNTGVIYGFTNTLLEVLQKQEPSHIGVVFDTSVPTFRHEEFPEYKANRQETPEDIKIGTPYVKKVIEGFGIPVIYKDGFEADDVIGTLAKKASKEGYDVYMMTPDKDFGQLVEDNIHLYKPAYMGNGVDIMGPEEVMAKWDIDDVDKVRDMLGLQGDSADNIPGIPGIGPKTAAKLLKEYGSVEGIVANADKLKGKQKERVEEFGEQGILSKRLATIIVDVPVDCDFDKLQYTGPEKEKLLPVFQELEFRTLIKRLFDQGKTTATKSNKGGQLDMFSTEVKTAVTAVKKETEEVEVQIEKSLKDIKFNIFELSEEEEILRLADFLLKQKSFTIESVTDHVNPVNANLYGLIITYLDQDVYYLDLSKKNEDELIKVFEILKTPLENREIEKAGHNIKYEFVLFLKWGIELKGDLIDIELAHYLIDPDLSHTIEVISDQYLNYKVLPEYAKYLDKQKRSAKLLKLGNREIIDSACEAAYCTLHLASTLKGELKDDPLKNLYYNIEMPLIRVLAKMEFEGVTIDKKELDEMSIEVGGICKKLESEIFSEAGEEFNVNSPKQLGDILFGKLKLVDKPKKTKSGQFATGEEILKTLEEHSIVGHILQYRELQKLKSTYIDALPGMISVFDNKIHTNYNQSVAATGRLSSINPNLQNIPVRTERGKLIRKAFIPSKKGWKILSADYSQIELRIMASFSEDSTMIEAFKNGEDIHAATAAKIFNTTIEEVDAAMRRKAKSVNFGLIYGQSAFGLAQNLNISRTEAKEIIDSYFDQFKAVKSYMDTIVNEAREKEYVETISGRRRYLRDINSRNQTMRGFAERNAINAPIQGSAADIIKIAMINMRNRLDKEKFQTKMVMQVHDELVFEVPEGELELVKSVVVETMVNAVDLRVPMVVDCGSGEHWLEAH